MLIWVFMLIHASEKMSLSTFKVRKWKWCQKEESQSKQRAGPEGSPAVQVPIPFQVSLAKKRPQEGAEVPLGHGQRRLEGQACGPACPCGPAAPRGAGGWRHLQRQNQQHHAVWMLCAAGGTEVSLMTRSFCTLMFIPCWCFSCWEMRVYYFVCVCVCVCVRECKWESEGMSEGEEEWRRERVREWVNEGVGEEERG